VGEWSLNGISAEKGHFIVMVVSQKQPQQNFQFNMTLKLIMLISVFSPCSLRALTALLHFCRMAEAMVWNGLMSPSGTSRNFCFATSETAHH